MSPDDDVELPVRSPGVGGNMHCLPSGRGLKQRSPQPDRFFLMKAKSLPKHPSLMAAARM
jgi:hypothetical protein